MSTTSEIPNQSFSLVPAGADTLFPPVAIVPTVEVAAQPEGCDRSAEAIGITIVRRGVDKNGDPYVYWRNLLNGQFAPHGYPSTGNQPKTTLDRTAEDREDVAAWLASDKAQALREAAGNRAGNVLVRIHTAQVDTGAVPEAYRTQDKVAGVGVNFGATERGRSTASSSPDFLGGTWRTPGRRKR